MAIVAPSAELNFDELYLGALGERVITNYTSTFAQAEDGGAVDRYYGNFIFSGDGALVQARADGAGRRQHGQPDRRLNLHGLTGGERFRCSAAK